jgi:uncharacterized protein (TIGR02270 family)
MYREHLEDASFLYVQRNSLMLGGTVPWVRIENFEERLEAHIDALVIGGQLALQVCRESLAEGEAGEMYAAVCVFCRTRGSAILAAVWQSLDYADKDKVAAVTDALKFELPNEWYPACEQAIARGDQRLVPIMSAVCASRRRPAGGLLTRRMTEHPGLVQPGIVGELARMSASREAVPALESFCLHADTGVRAAALKGLLYAGERRALQSFYLQAQTESWPQMALGLGGDQSAAAVLRSAAENGKASDDTLLALALIGDVSAVPSLCEYLANEQLAENAAVALHWLTGAPLFEEEFVPEEVDELELLDAELAAWDQRGELPKRIDGKPFGHTIQRLSTDATRWREWWQTHSGRFDRRLRYRRGLPATPAVLLNCLLDEACTLRMREWAYDELVIRFECPVAFEPNWRVNDQRSALRAMSNWAAKAGQQFDPGRWR